jgi:hypothetical protein
MQVPEFIIEKKSILKQMFIWDKMTAEERADFLATTSEIRAESKVRELCRKYL